MSKRAEERGLEALPPRWRKTKDGKGKIDSALPVRKFYIRAYEQAEKDLGWISVKDKLPEKNGWYFTCVEQFNIPQCVGITYFDKKTDGWYNDIPMGKKLFMTTIEIVDYWMEIPELPKEE